MYPSLSVGCAPPLSLWYIIICKLTYFFFVRFTELFTSLRLCRSSVPTNEHQNMFTHVQLNPVFIACLIANIVLRGYPQPPDHSVTKVHQPWYWDFDWSFTVQFGQMWWFARHLMSPTWPALPRSKSGVKDCRCSIVTSALGNSH